MAELTIEHMVATAENYMKYLREQNLDGICNMYSIDAVVEDPVGSEPKVGAAAIREGRAAGRCRRQGRDA